MDSTALWTDAWTSALPAWVNLVRHSGWHPVLAAAAFATVGGLCLAVGRSSRVGGGATAIWSIAAAALLMLALNTLFAFDALAIQVLRTVAREQGWHGARREVQGLALAATALAGLAACRRFRYRLALREPGHQRLLLGLTLLVALAVLRAVSLHATDELIHGRMAGLSVGRLLDALGLGFLAAGVHQATRAVRA